MAGRFRSLFKVFRRKRKRRPEAAPAQLPEKREQFQPLKDDAALDKTRQREPSRGRLHKTLKHRNTSTRAAEVPAEPDCTLTKFEEKPPASPEWTADSGNNAMNYLTVKSVHMAATESMAITKTDNRMTQGITNTGSMPTPTVICAPTRDFFEDSAAPSQQQVPAIVRSIHQRLLSHVAVDARLQIDIVRLAEEHPADVVLTLLRCAPTCDRAATMIWRTVGSSGPAVEKVLPTLLCVMEDWPLHRARTSDGDDGDVFALAATLVIWVIVPECHKAMIPFSGQLFVALLSHIVITTQQMPPEEIDTIWRACQEEHRLPSNYNRFAVQAMKALLYRLRCDKEVMAVERMRGWKMLLCADTQHYAVGLLAREMFRIFIPLCFLIAIHLLKRLHREEPRQDLPLLAFLVEVLQCLDLRKCGDSILEIMSRHLQSECRERRRLALRGLVVLSKDPLRARRMCCLSKKLVELLGDADGYAVSMTLSVLTNILENEHILISSTTAPKLAEALLPLFDCDDIHMQLLSLNLFFKVMDLVVDKGKKPLKKIVSQSLLPLFFHCHDENKRVAKASRELLLCVVRFLRRRKLEQLLEREKMLEFADCLLAEDRSRAAEHLRWALPYLRSPQEPLREAAVRFMGSAQVLMRGKKEELEVLNEAIHIQKKGSLSHCSRNIQGPSLPAELKN